MNFIDNVYLKKKRKKNFFNKLWANNEGGLYTVIIHESHFFYHFRLKFPLLKFVFCTLKGSFRPSNYKFEFLSIPDCPVAPQVIFFRRMRTPIISFINYGDNVW